MREFASRSYGILKLVQAGIDRTSQTCIKGHEFFVKERQELSHQNPYDIVRWIGPEVRIESEMVVGTTENCSAQQERQNAEALDKLRRRKYIVEANPVQQLRTDAVEHVACPSVQRSGEGEQHRDGGR